MSTELASRPLSCYASSFIGINVKIETKVHKSTVGCGCCSVQVRVMLPLSTLLVTRGALTDTSTTLLSSETSTIVLPSMVSSKTTLTAVSGLAKSSQTVVRN